MSRTAGAIQDITEQKRAEEDAAHLSRRLIQAQEAERALLARELHDDVTQRLAVLAIDARPGRVRWRRAARSREVLQTVREGLVRLSEDIHSLAYRLHPSVLEELGLAEALRAECERSGAHGGIAVTLDLDPVPAAVGKDAALCLYRVAQEALNNVARHARARAASVVLRQMDGGLLLAVKDDGVGFDPDESGARASPRPGEHARAPAAGERHARHRERARPRDRRSSPGCPGKELRSERRRRRPRSPRSADDHLPAWPRR
ncbi:MAG: histidine kinase [Chromatiales bacterium]|nr:histidine kinase [Chromatiales bacterium]